jgi:hypothetical protein
VHVTKASAVLLKTKKEQHRHSLTMNQIVFWGKNINQNCTCITISAPAKTEQAKEEKNKPRVEYKLYEQKEYSSSFIDQK